MTAPSGQTTVAANRRPQVARFYLEGWRQPAIAEKLGVNQATISRDLATLRREWMASAVMDFNEAKARELARIDKLEIEYWQEWEASKAATKKTAIKGKGKGNKPDYLEKTETVEERHGDPRYLEGVRWCVEQRLKIYGIYEATKIRVEDWQTDIINGLKSGQLKPEDIAVVYPDLATEFFARAGIAYEHGR